MNATATRRLGRTSVEVTQLGLGGAPFGDLFVRLEEEAVQRTLEAAWEAGIRFYDTAPYYGFGLSEHRVGRFLRGRPRDELVLSTKVGRVLRPLRGPRPGPAFWAGGLPFEGVFDYGYDGVMRAYEDSLQRLGLARVDLLVIHDLDFGFHETEERVSAHLRALERGGSRALEELRRSGEIGAIGAGVNELGMIPRLLDAAGVDFFLIATPYNLLDQEALDGDLQLCAERGVGVVIGAVFASGILAADEPARAPYRYSEAPPEVVARVERMRAVCARHGVPLGAAALQFPLGHPSVAAVIPGALAPEHVRANVERFALELPGALWEDLKAEGLLRADAPVPP